MQIKHITFVFLFLLTAFCAASQGQSNCCSLPAPSNFTNVVNQPTYLEYSFTPVPGATGYRVTITYPSGTPPQVFDINDGNASSFSAVVEPETRNTAISCKFGNCVCPDYVDQTTTVNLIVADLVAGLHTPASGERVFHCGEQYFVPNFTLSCDLPIGSDQINHIFSFSFEGTVHTGGIRITKDKETNNTRMSFYPLMAVSNWSYQRVDSFHVRYRRTSPSSGAVVAGLEFMGYQSTLEISTLGSSYEYMENFTIQEIVRLSTGREADTDEYISANAVFVSPNPFNDNLTLTMEAPETGNVSVQLYNLTGGLQKSLVVTPAELTNNTYSISTTDLATGMYIMQVSTDQGVRHTSKVFKL
jgi:hypothetical protein